ncbi:amino acid permease [Rubrobacter tropicus]|uniref:amino acid permease n=1 Tax=Rubrobacter tropicus TaxID=2653851 RepID=UPI001D17F1AC|nr:amino acid permease [Rubrobacter tropicus]
MTGESWREAAVGIMRTKSIEQSIRDTEEPEFRLSKSLGPLDLTVFGIGVIIGTGLFVLTGEAAAGYAGPAIALSYVVAGLACALAALCYAEFASTVPVAGSAYTFSYAALGEFVAWLIGWDLILEFTLGAATVAKGWSGYFVSVFKGLGITVPPGLYAAEPDSAISHDWLAVLVILGMTVILVIGIKLSSQFNQVITAIKVLVTLFIIGFGVWFIDAANLTPFIPAPAPGEEAYGTALDAYLLPSILGIDTIYGITGIFTGAALVFFAYIGFDIVATTSEEARNPQRDIPIGIFASLGICTVLYILASVVFTGLRPYKELATAAPAATALENTPFPAAQLVVSAAILVGLTVVVMILMLGQSRVAFAMSRDNLLPRGLARVHPSFRTPYRITIITGIVASVLAFFLPLTTLGELVNIGTLSAFVLVSIGVLVLRRTRPDLPRAFRTPLVPAVPIAAASLCLFVMGFLTIGTWIRFLAWMALGVVIYFAYSRGHSRLGREGSSED